MCMSYSHQPGFDPNWQILITLFLAISGIANVVAPKYFDEVILLQFWRDFYQ